MSNSKAKFDLENQLGAYSATKPENWSAHLKRWPIYAAATGAALAMATSADAGTIMTGYSGSSVTRPGSGSGYAGNFLDFDISGNPGPVPPGWMMVAGGPAWGFASVEGADGLSFATAWFWLDRFGRGQSITSHVHFGTSGVVRDVGNPYGPGWGGTANGGSGYAGFRIPASTANASGYDLGWIQLTWLSSMGNGVPTELIAGDWGLNTTPNMPIQAGVPEPGTMALSLLALGASGILAWRKRRRSGAQ